MLNFILFLLQPSATTNESVSHSGDIATALKTFFPSIHFTDVKELIEVCNFYYKSKRFNVNLVTIQAYPVSDFAFSADLQFQTITGDSEFRCAVSPDHSPHLFVFCANGISYQSFSSGRSWAKSSVKV